MKKINKSGYITIVMVLAIIISAATPAFATTQDVKPKITVTKDSKGIIHETMDYKFTLDKDAVGEWKPIDCVESIDKFDSNNLTRRDYIWAATHTFYEDGKMITNSVNDKGVKETNQTKWTKGYVFEMGSYDTISAYEIKKIKDKTFMFVEWKSGDYTMRGEKPLYYVYLKTSNTPKPKIDPKSKTIKTNSGLTVNLPGSIKDENAKLTTTIDDKGERHDNLDYKFTLDKDAVGEWKGIYCCENISDFNPAQITKKEQFWSGHSIYADGTMATRIGGHTLFNIHWTKGYFVDIIYESGIPAYAITTIKGKMYMIVEWKSGDYIKNGYICYYVFEKTSNTPEPPIDPLSKPIKTKSGITINMPGSIKDENAKLTTTIDAKGERHDSLDYKFTLDKDAVGEWKLFNAYDVNKIAEQFKPNGNGWPRISDWAGNSIYADGTMIEHHIDGLTGSDSTGFIFYNWTKGYIMDGLYNNGNVPAYAITTINGKTFMFIGLKSGFYNRAGIIECCYVFVKTSDTPVHSVNKPAKIPTPISYIQDSNTKFTTTIDGSGGKHDSLEYTFTLDKDAVGQWKEIDFVGTIEQFDSTILTRREYIHPDIYDFYEDGKMIINYTGSKIIKDHNWTKGYIIGALESDDDIPAYEITTNNDKKYMIVEVKNADYGRMGSTPGYVILEKTSNTPAPRNNRGNLISH
ncbi:MAG: hypothetical protein ACYDG2_16160 [Ruminiclostridium sp.]